MNRPPRQRVFITTPAAAPLSLVATLFLIASAAAQSPPSSLGVAVSQVAVPLRIENGLLYIGGNVNGSPQLSFIVDTAATTTSLDPGVAEAARIAVDSKVPLMAARRTFPEQTFALASTAYITALSGQPTAGVLGEPQFHRYSLGLDFDRDLAALLSPEVCPSAAARLPIVTAGGLPFVEGSIPLPDGQTATGLFLIDTAQPGPGIVLAASFLAAHPGLTTGAKMQQSDAASLIRLPELRLGTLTLHAPIAELEAANGSVNNPRLAGVLGMEALRRFNLVLNQRYATLYLEPNSHSKEAFEADMSGMRLNASKTGKIVVTAVASGSPAAQAHIQTGDVLIVMEDKPLTAANLGSVVNALRSAPGATVHLTIEGSSRPQKVTLRLKRML